MYKCFKLKQLKIKNMHAVSSNQIAEFSHFNDNEFIKYNSFKNDLTVNIQSNKDSQK